MPPRHRREPRGTYRAIAPRCRDDAQRSGRIITISSIFGRIGAYGFVTAMPRPSTGVIGLTRALAAELGSQAIPDHRQRHLPGYVRAGMGVKTQSTNRR